MEKGMHRERKTQYIKGKKNIVLSKNKEVERTIRDSLVYCIRRIK